MSHRSIVTAVVLSLVFPATRALGLPPVGKQSVFVAANNILLNDGITGVAPILTGVINKGKKKSNLAIFASMTMVDVTTPSLPSLEVTVNGMAATGPAVAFDCKFAGAARCSLAGTWYFDVEAAEAAQPGAFVGQPLNVVLISGTNTVAPPTSTTANAVLSVLVTKK